MPKQKTTEEFIKDAIKFHGNEYDYSKVDYINTRTSVIIICKIHDDVNIFFSRFTDDT